MPDLSKEVWRDSYHNPERLDFSRVPAKYKKKIKQEISFIQGDVDSLHFFKLIVTPEEDVYLQTISQKKINKRKKKGTIYKE